MVLLFLWILAMTTHASNLTNAIEGVGPNGLTRPYLCVVDAKGKVSLALAPDQRGEVNHASESSNSAQLQLKFGGCEPKNENLGTVWLSIGNHIRLPTITNYQAPYGSHVSYINREINVQGKLTGNIIYRPIQANFNLSAAQSSQNFKFVGINLSGLEFGQIILPSKLPNLSQEDADTVYSDLADTEAFIQAGMNTIRIPIDWTYLQWNGPGRMILNQEYYANYIKPMLQTLTSAKVHTILDLHSNMHYAVYGQHELNCPKNGFCHSGTLIIDESAYTYVWEQLWQEIQQDANINSEYLLFDLANAPLHVPEDKVFTIQTTLIKQLRLHDFRGYILVQGNAGSELRTWSTYRWVGEDGKTYSNASLFTRDNFLRAGIKDLSKILINVHQYFDEGYLGIHQKCLQNLGTTGPDGFNLESFIDYLRDNNLQAIVSDFTVGKNAESCAPPLKEFMTYLLKNSSQNQSYGFAGWTIWSTGHAWDNDHTRLRPNSYIMEVLNPFINQSE